MKIKRSTIGELNLGTNAKQHEIGIARLRVTKQELLLAQKSVERGQITSTDLVEFLWRKSAIARLIRSSIDAIAKEPVAQHRDVYVFATVAGIPKSMQTHTPLDHN